MLRYMHEVVSFYYDTIMVLGVINDFYCGLSGGWG